MVLQEIGLGLLKFLSSHRGLTYVSYAYPVEFFFRPSFDHTAHSRSHELFDEYTRRQFLSKAPEKNPFGTAEEPAKFAQFDVFTKVRSPGCSVCQSARRLSVGTTS